MADLQQFLVNMALHYRKRTRIGVALVPALSKQENRVAVLAVVSEGQVEEPGYIRYVIAMCRRKYNTRMAIHIINDELEAMGVPSHESNPVTRLHRLKEWLLRYNPEYETHLEDSAWLICDRDDGSFSVRQFRNVVWECERSRIHFIISNPAFQIWLLFHFADDINLPLLNRAKYSKGKLREVERQLSTYIPDYVHGKIDMSNFEYLIEAAMQNSQNYATSVSILKRHVGTNFATLMEFIKECFGIQSFNQI